MNTPRGIPLRPDRTALAYQQRRSLHRALASIALAGRERTSPDRFVRAIWPGDVDAVGITRAATSPTGTGDYPSVSSAALMPLVAPAAAATRLFARSTQVDLSGLSTIQLVFPDTVPLPAFVAEGAAAPVAQLVFTGTTLGPVRKLLLITGLSNELESASPEAASVIIGRSLDQAASLAVDAAAFATTPGDATKPPGLLNGVTPIVATAGGGLNALVTDISKLAGAVATAGFGDEMVLIMNPAQVVRLRLLTTPSFSNVVLGSVAVAAGTIIAVAPSGIGVAYDGTAVIEIGSDAVLHWESATPLAIHAGSAPGVAANPTRSAWQEDLKTLRLRAWCAWAAIPGSVQFMVSTTW